MSNMDEKMGEASFSGVNEAVREKYVFGIYSEKEMLTKLKALALNHDKPRVTPNSIRPLWDQTLRVREVMALTKFPQRKRKLQQFLKDNFKREAQKLCNEQREAKFRGQLSQASSASCVHNMTDSIENLPKRILLNSLSSGSLLTLEDNFERQRYVSSIMDNDKDWYHSDRITSLLVDLTGSVHGSNPVTPEHMNIPEPESLHLEDGSNSSNLEESRYVCPPSRSNMLISFSCDQFERMAVPVGHHFQADVPEWGRPYSEVSLNADSNDSRWLGTKVWPIKRQIVKATSRVVGKGRLSTCSCASPGETNCVRHHILEKRRLLQSDLGPLFHIWKFDEMGEEVSKSWTVKEQESFDSIAKRKSSSSNFIQSAMKFFPSKCKKDITSYYFNIFIPRFMSSQTRSLLKEVDIDIDDVNDVYTLNIRRSRKDRSSSSRGGRKDVISR